MENTNYESGPVSQYHRAKTWQIALFSLNNTATNIYLFAFNFLSFYAVGFLGLMTATVTNMLGMIRLFDGLIDPTIGIIIDKIDTRWGKYRPAMIGGNIALILSFLMLFNLHQIENTSLRFIAFIFVLIFHKIGYSFQQTVTKAAQAVLTNDPKQRPTFSIFDNIFSSILIFTLGGFFVSKYLVPKHGGFENMSFFVELVTITIVVSTICTILAVIGLASKDRKEYFGLGEVEENNYKFKDILGIIKSNKPLKILALAAGLMKFVATLIGDNILMVLLFGIVLGNYELLGEMALMVVIPNFIIVSIMSVVSGKKGLKWAYNTSVIVALLSFIGMGAIIMMSNDPTALFSNGYSTMGIIFIITYVGAKIFTQYPASLSLTMSADITDYETAQSGRFASGLIGTVFSFTDSIASSMAPVVSGWIAVFIGYTKELPEVTDKLTSGILNGTVMGLVAIPVVCLVVIAFLVKSYPLDANEMEVVQAKIADKKRGVIAADE